MPTDDKASSDAMHFRSLSLENVRAFGSKQSIEFGGAGGPISHWNLILGENGVGKTTLMQALAVMWPVPAYKEPPESPEAAPTISRAELSEHEEDADIWRFVRENGPGPAEMTAVLETDLGVRVRVGVTVSSSGTQLEDVKWLDDAVLPSGGGPLVIGYGAGRHLGLRNLAVVEKRKSTESLFSDTIDLYDAEEILEKLDHAAKSDGLAGGGDARRLEALKSAVAAMLPEGLTSKDIEIRGPRLAGRAPNQSGVHVTTPSGVMALKDLSLGYQTMFALTVDLVWRLFNAFPKSAEPLRESAIVLIDEVDLHLHPRWQRDLRRHMLEHFPCVQFIVTSHSPVTAQETLSATSEGSSTLSVLRWEDGEARILGNPIPKGEWRSDQLLESELFGFGADRAKAAERKIYERIRLSRIPNRSADQEAELSELDDFVASLPTAPSPDIQSFEDLMTSMAKDYPKSLIP